MGARAKKWPTFNQQNQKAQRYGQSDLEAGYTNAGAQGIVPGAHPQYDQPTPGEKLIDAFKNIIRPKPKRGTKP